MKSKIQICLQRHKCHSPEYICFSKLKMKIWTGM